MPTADQIQDVYSLAAAAQRVISAAAPVTLTNNPSQALWQALLDAIGDPALGGGLSDADREFITESLATMNTNMTAAQQSRLAAEQAYQSSLALSASTVTDLVALRTFTGVATAVTVTGWRVSAKPIGIQGLFVVDPSIAKTQAATAGLDDGGQTIVDGTYRTWRRQTTIVSLAHYQGAGQGGDDAPYMRLADAARQARQDPYYYIPSNILNNVWKIYTTVKVTGMGFLTDTTTGGSTQLGTKLQFVPSNMLTAATAVAAGLPASRANTPPDALDGYPMLEYTYYGYDQPAFQRLGPTPYTMANLVSGGYVDPTKFKAQRLDALTAGYVAVLSSGAGHGIFRGGVAGGFKFEHQWTTTEGHCELSYPNGSGCLYQIFVDQNHEDYIIKGGGCGGLLGGVLMSNRSAAGHSGGANFKAVEDLHFFGCPRPFSFLYDPTITNDGGALGLYNTHMRNVSIEQLGECFIDVPDDVSQKGISMENTRWVGFATARAGSNPDSSVWQYGLPVELDPVGGAQKNLFRMGKLSGFTAPGSFFDFSGTHVMTGGASAASQVLFHYTRDQDPGSQEGRNFESMNGSIELAPGNALAYRSSTIKDAGLPRVGQALGYHNAKKTDLARASRFKPDGNAVGNPEAYNLAMGEGTLNNAAEANGGHWYALSTTTNYTNQRLSTYLTATAAKVAAGTALTQDDVSSAMLDPRMFGDIDQRTDMMLTRIQPQTEGQGFNAFCSLNNNYGVATNPYELVTWSAWVLVTNDGSTSGTFTFGPALRGNDTAIAEGDLICPIGKFIKVTRTDFAYAAPGSSSNSLQALGFGMPANSSKVRVYIAGLRVNYTGERAYNKHTVAYAMDGVVMGGPVSVEPARLTATTGVALVYPASAPLVELQNTATVASLIVTLPMVYLFAASLFEVYTPVACTAFSINLPTGYTLAGPATPTALNAGESVLFRVDGATKTVRRVKYV